MNNFGLIGTFLVIFLVLISIWFSMITASLIATSMHLIGWDWWVVTITIFASLGGTTGGSLIQISKE